MVSVIIPAYNSREFISDAVSSALAQTYPHIEVIVVDDGSVDDTGGMLRDRFGERIRYIYKKNGGPASARNLGIRESRGEFVAFLDADDLWKPEKLDVQRQAFRDDILLVGCCAGSQNAGPAVAVTFEDLLIRNRFSNSGVMVRRSAFDLAGLLDERPEFRAVEDWDMWLRLAKAGPILLLQRDLITLRVMANSISAPAQAESMLHNERAVLRKHLPGRGRLYARALSERYLSAAWAFKVTGKKQRALQSLLWSYFWCPARLFDRRRLGLLLKAW